MKKIYGNLLLFLSFFLFGLSAQAQSNPFDVKVTTQQDQTVYHDNVYSNIKTFELDLKFEHDIDAKSTAVKAEYSLQTPDKETVQGTMTADVADKHVTAAGKMAVAKTGDYTLTCKLTWKTEQGTPKKAESKKTIKAKLYTTPQVKAGTFKNVVFSGNKQTLKVTATGGNEAGWKYSWNVGGSAASIQYTANAATGAVSGNSSTNDVVVTAKNYGPDGTTLWSSKEETFTIKAWKKASYTMNQSDVDVMGSETLKLGVKVAGGDPSAWKYAWTLDGTSLGSTAEVTKTLSDGKATTHNYKLVLTNKPAGIAEDEGYSAQATGKVYYWQDITVKDLCDPEIVMISSKSKTLGIQTEGGNTSGWTYTWDNGKGNVPSFSYVAQNEGEGSKTEKIKFTAVNRSVTGKTLKTINKTYSLTVWPAPVYNGSSTQESITCSGRQNALILNVKGGAPSDWKYEWKKNGQPIVCNSSTYSYVEKTTEKATDNYSVEVSYDYEGVSQIKETVKFTVTVWPEPVITKVPAEEEPGYYGESKTFEIDFKGGYEPLGAEESSGWSYEWYIGENKQDDAGKTLTYKVPEGEVNGMVHNLRVKLVNRYKGIVWKSEDRAFKVSAWSKGQVSALATDSIDATFGKTSVRHGSLFKLTSKVEGGYDKGWTFSWKQNGTSLPQQKTSSLEMKCTDGFSKFRDDEYTLHYANKIDEKVGCEGDVTYNLRIWAEAQFPEAIQGAEQVRKNQDYVLQVAPGVGGYAQNWQYRWSNQGQGLQSSFNESYLFNNAYQKEIKTTIHEVLVGNYGPSQHIWHGKTLQHVVKVYNQPETPKRLIRKGSGKSNTLICMSSFQDPQLVNYDYTFVFGYDMSDGVEKIFEAPDHKRYITLPRNEFEKVKWVYAKWVYEDGTIVTSGKRYIDGSEDDTYNGSSFVTGNRAPSDETGVEDIFAQSETLEFVGNSFVVNLSAPAPARLSIYNVNGRLLDRQTFDARCSYDEAIQTDQLTPGVYMVEVIVGQQRIVKKISVR